MYPIFQGGLNGPWKTLDKINKTIICAGDTINLRCNSIWHETLNVNWVGSKFAPIIIKSYGDGEKPLLHGGDLVTDWSGPDCNGVFLAFTKYGIDWLLEDNEALDRSTGPECFDGNWYYFNNTIYYRPRTGIPNDHMVSKLMRWGSIVFTGDSSWIIFDGLKFIGKGIWKYHGNHNICNIIIKNCDFYHCRDAISITRKDYKGFYKNILITNCFFIYCRFSIFLSNMSESQYGFKNICLSHNTVKHSNSLISGKRWQLDNTDTSAFYLQNLINSVIEHNDISGWCDYKAAVEHWAHKTFASTGVVFRYNFIHDIRGAGISWGGDGQGINSAEIYANIICNYGSGTQEKIWGGLRLRNSQSEKNPSKIYNNIIYNGDDGIYGANIDNYIIKNNIIAKHKKYNIRFNFPSINNIMLDYNCYDNFTNFKFLLQPYSYNFICWQIASNQDKNSLIADPLFKSPSNGDFRLSSASPCIMAGTNVGISYDFIGNKYKNPPSIGAIEFYNNTDNIRN